jgi:hypothetical protein
MKRSALRLAIAAMAVLVVLGGATAYAAYPDTPAGAQHDCGAGHDPLVGHYTASVLTTALATLSPSDRQYTNCPDSLQNALDALLKPHHTSGGGGTKPPSGGGTHTTTTQTATSVSPPPNLIHSTLNAASAAGAHPRTIGGVTVTPGAVANSAFLNSIPTPLIVVLAALAATLAALGAHLVRSRVRTRRSS